VSFFVSVASSQEVSRFGAGQTTYTIGSKASS